MGNGTAEVVDHEFEDRLDLILAVSSVVSNRGILDFVSKGEHNERRGQHIPIHLVRG